METFEIIYTWSGTLEVEAEDENAAVEEAWKQLMEHPARHDGGDRIGDYQDKGEETS